MTFRATVCHPRRDKDGCRRWVKVILRGPLRRPIPILLVLLARLDGGPWVPVWEDTFDRPEIGEEWQVLCGRARIEDGWLLLEGAGATIGTTRGFPGELRVTFVARSVPGRPPCDLSVSLCTNPDWGWSPGCFFAFGGDNNKRNQLIWPGGRAVDRSPSLLIEPGRTYRITATRAGGLLTLSIDGRVILSAREEGESLAGAGFDRVALVTWTGMLVDRIRIEGHPGAAPPEPAPLPPLPLTLRDGVLVPRDPAAGDPRLARALALFAKGHLAPSARAFEALPDGILKAAGLAWCYGHIDYEERRGDFERLADLFARIAASRPEDVRLAEHARASRAFARLRILRGSPIAAVRLTVRGPRENPYYPKALLFHARYLWWDAAEGGNARKRAAALRYFRRLKALSPRHPIVRGYLGERVPWDEALAERPEGVPAWAADLREAYVRQIRILGWWFAHRQTPDGQLGGGWGDDVELLRSWGPVAAISTGAPEVTRGIERLCEGVWRYVLEDGYARELGDVEHSAEPSADVLPALMLLRYGDPRPIEWNLRSAATIRARHLARDGRGHLRFRSTVIGAGGASANPRDGGDTAYHARAMKHFLWLAWYGNDEAKAVLSDWARGWRDATMDAARGKPAGIPPGTIWYPSGEIAPPGGAPWWHPDWNYYGWPGPISMIYDTFLAAYRFSGDRAFLDPLRAYVRIVRGPRRAAGSGAPGSPAWAQARVQGWNLRDTLAQYRWLEGDTAFDDLLLPVATPAVRFLITGDRAVYEASFARTARSLRDNFALRTSEVIMTDRAGLGGAAATFAAYTGGVRLWRSSGLPTMAVTWIVPDPDFAALVTEAGPGRLRARLYHFHEEPIDVGLRLWRLRPGRYALRAGEILPGDGGRPDRHARGPAREVEILHRGETVTVPVPPRTPYAVDLVLLAAREVPPRAPDLAIARRDIDGIRSRGGVTLRVRVHNVGSADARDVRVRAEDPRRHAVAETAIDHLPAPRDLTPSMRRVEIHLAGADAAGPFRVVLDPEDRIFEIFEGNNAALTGVP